MRLKCLSFHCNKIIFLVGDYLCFQTLRSHNYHPFEIKKSGSFVFTTALVPPSATFTVEMYVYFPLKCYLLIDLWLQCKVIAPSDHLCKHHSLLKQHMQLCTVNYNKQNDWGGGAIRGLWKTDRQISRWPDGGIGWINQWKHDWWKCSGDRVSLERGRWLVVGDWPATGWPMGRRVLSGSLHGSVAPD